jgi:hypothetical protein
MSEFLQKLLSKAKEKADSLEEEPVDNSLLISQHSASPKEAHAPRPRPSLKEAHPPKEVSKHPSLKEGASLKAVGRDIDGQQIRITNNFCFFDRDLFELCRELKEAELRIYLELFNKTYAVKNFPTNICSCTNSELTIATGITSSSAFSRAFKLLESKGLIKRLIISRTSNEKSLFRVYLPCELPGSNSKTKVEPWNTKNDLP